MRMNIAKLQHTKPFMPPFAGTAEELESLVQYVKWSTEGRPSSWETLEDANVYEQIENWLADAGTEPATEEQRSGQGAE